MQYSEPRCNSHLLNLLTSYILQKKKKKKRHSKILMKCSNGAAWTFYIFGTFWSPFLQFRPDSGHSFLTRSTLSEAGRSFLKWLHLVTGVPMLMCQHTTKQLRTRLRLGRGDKVMLWTKRCIQTGEKERSGSKCLHVLIFVYPWCISIPTISSSVLFTVFVVIEVWRKKLFHLMNFCNLYKKKDTSPTVRHQNDICFSHLHSRIDFFHIYSKNVKKWHS